ncbi:MAG: mechanosensitive ion channel family protein [Armatimonadota bacterium]
MERLAALWERWSEAVLTGGLKIALVLALVLVARWIGGRVIYAALNALQRRLEASERRAAQLRTLATLLISILNYTLLFVALLTILSVFGVDLGPVLATAGITGLAISFGAQRLVRDLINGFFILLEDQFAVGEYVTVDGISGTVETMGMRITRLRDDEGRLVTIANGDINRVINHSRGEQRLALEVGIANTVALPAAREWLTRTVEAFQHPALRSPLSVQGPATLESTRYLFRIEGRVANRQGTEVQDALREHILLAAQKEGIPLA